MTSAASAPACRGCADRGESLIQLGVAPGRWDFLVALAGNPNTGKSTVFNALTGLRQHTGNWPGKTVSRAEGTYKHADQSIKVVDLPGTYSLQAASVDEEVARDFLLFGRPDVTVIVIDATRLERNLNLALLVVWSLLALLALARDLDPGPWGSLGLGIIGLYFFAFGLFPRRDNEQE